MFRSYVPLGSRLTSAMSIWTLTAMLMAMGAQAAPLVPGRYSFRLPGRSSCPIRGYLAARPCGTPSAASPTLTPQLSLTAGSGLQAWQLVPVAASVTSLTNATRVYLKSTRGCDALYATSLLSCGGLALSGLAPGSVRQQWNVEQWGVYYRLRPAACKGVFLGFSSYKCNMSSATLLKAGTGIAVSFVLARTDPKPAPAIPSKGTNVTVSLLTTQRWGNGDPRGAPFNTSYEACFVIRNPNSFYILNWKLTFKVVGGGNFTWGPSDTELSWSGAGSSVNAVLSPKEWLKEIPPNGSLAILFGGYGSLPTALAFVQILPLLDPNNDPSLARRGIFPGKLFAPFIDATLHPTPNLLDIHAATGQRWFTLAFITADLRTREPAWGGVIPLWKQYFADQVRDIRMLGGDCIVSFGGAAGQELAQVRQDENLLLADYQRVVDLYRLRWVDFDIEGGAIKELASVQRRHRVVRRLQAANPGLTVSFTLPVLPTGLTADGVNMLKDARAAGVRVDIINLMTMDYGDSAAPDPDGRMGDYAIQAAVAARQQATAVGYSNAKIGNTPMIGLNDVQTETFQLADARKVGAWARATPWVRWTAFWSAGRDRWDPAEAAYVSIHSSSIPQQPYEFTSIFRSYAG